MATHKPAGKKRRLSRHHRMRRAVPTWVVSKTRGHVRSHPKKRNWRDGKLRA